MAKTANQKTRILSLCRILLRYSDDDHRLTVTEMLEALSAEGIEANRKTVMDDLHAMADFGLDVICSRGKGGGYFIGNREFETAELKLLVDAVQSSRFISQKKSTDLIGRLLKQTSVYTEKDLHRQIYVAHRVKSENAELLRTVDAVHSAIGLGRMIAFRYSDWNGNHERVLRHDGKEYRLTPCMLSWDNEYYYLLAYDSEEDRLKHFRVDKMVRVRVLDEPQRGETLWGDIVRDPGKYENELFGMYSGEETTVLLAVDASLAGVIIDRFGEETVFISDGEGAKTFRVAVKVRVSPVFLSWVLQFGEKMRILSPDSVRQSLISLAERAIGANREKGNE
jgi:predicted DNA-binding transcriptional regulator YafY